MRDLPTQPRQTRVQQSFRRGLDTYHAAATHQADIAERLADCLATVAPTSLPNVFEFGVGTGHLTQAIQRRFSVTRLLLNDLVAECASFAPPSVRFLPGPVQQIPLPENLDLICSASTVQWLDDLPATINQLSNHLRPGGWLALSGFGTAQFHELRSLGSTAAAPSYCDAEAWRDILPETLKIKHLSQARRVEWFPNAVDVLRHLRETGVNGAASQKWSAKDLRVFETNYRDRFGTPQGLPLSYDPVWIIAQKS